MQIKEGEMNSQTEAISLKLYIASGTPNSVLAMNNLQAILDECPADYHSLEVIDVLKDPARAIVDGVLVTPTLVKTSPSPKVSIIGNLGDKDKVLYALNLGVVPK
jgi:circadian clock protein KaiB